MCDNNFTGFVASLFSWRCLVASTSSFLHAAMNLRLPSVTVSTLTHTSSFNAVAFQPPAVPNARMQLCTQSVYHTSTFLLSAPCSPYCMVSAPSKFPNMISLWQPATAHSDERSGPQKSSRTQCCLNALTSSCLEGMVIRGHPLVWSLAVCPDNAKQDPVVYGAEFGVVFLAKGPRTASIQEGLDWLDFPPK